MPSASDLNKTGADLFLRGDMEGARLHYVAALKLDPGFVPALANLSVVLNQLGLLSSSVVLMQKLVSIVPTDGKQWNNLGNVLTRLERYEEALVAFKNASDFIPDDPILWHNLGLLEYRSQNYEEALDYFSRASALGRNGPDIENDRAHVLLAMGKLDEALPLYESRWHTLQHLPPWDYHIPEWQGNNLAGKHLLFHAEQGFGDTIMTSRFSKNLVELGAKVTLCVPPGLKRLFEMQEWRDVDCLSYDDLNESVVKDFDFQSPMYSGIRWLDIKPEDINSEPYISPPPLVVPPVFRGVRNVGICWASGKRNSESDFRRRVTDLNLWLPLSQNPDIQLWALQKDDELKTIYDLGAETIVGDVMNSLNDWADTAAFIDKLDLVISVDTAVAHLSAAMGKPTIMLSQFSNCWRWWKISEGSGEPWYSSMAIIQQPKPGDWKSVLEVVNRSLQNSASEFGLAA